MQYLREVIIAQPWILAFWVFVVGSAIGSFLNVVIYRLPRGMSLSKPGSRCPRCGHAIRWYHNLPIAGWLLLQGKCYDCKAAISPRYPLVELAVAVIFVVIAYLDIYLPALQAGQGAQANDDPTATLTRDDLIAFVAHAWLTSCLLAAVLVRFDGRRVPGRLILSALVVAAIAVPFLKVSGMVTLLILVTMLLIVALVRRTPGNPSPTTFAGKSDGQTDR